MAGIDEIKRLKGLCEEYNLEGREILDKYTDEELAALFNGIGPEAFPSWLRTALDALHPSLAPVAMIHDVEWSESDGKEETFAASNARFRRNGCKVASASFGWWNMVPGKAREFMLRVTASGENEIAFAGADAFEGDEGALEPPGDGETVVYFFTETASDVMLVARKAVGRLET